MEYMKELPKDAILHTLPLVLIRVLTNGIDMVFSRSSHRARTRNRFQWICSRRRPTLCRWHLLVMAWSWCGLWLQSVLLSSSSCWSFWSSSTSGNWSVSTL